jgi:hypothetical protein
MTRPRPDELRALLDRAQLDDLAAQRRRERSLLQQAGEEGRLAGMLAALAGRGWPVAVRTVTGRSHHGRVVTVGEDFCSLDGGSHLPLSGIATVRPDPGLAAASAAISAPVGTDRTFRDLLVLLAEERPPVAVGLRGGGELLVGTLTAVGLDVVTVVLDGADRRPCYVALLALTELSLPASEPLRSGRGSG